MATLLNFTKFKVISRTIRLTCFDYDVIVVCFGECQNIRVILLNGINTIR